MTAPELQALARIESKLDDHGERLRRVEQELAALNAVDQERTRQSSRSATTTRWLVGLTITATLSILGLAALLLETHPGKL